MEWEKIAPGCIDAAGVATLKCIPAVFKILIEAALLFAGVIAVIFIIIGGFKYISSGGDPKQAGGAQQTITWAIVGLVVVLLSFFILNFISDTTGVDCIRFLSFTSCQ